MSTTSATYDLPDAPWLTMCPSLCRSPWAGFCPLDRSASQPGEGHTAPTPLGVFLLNNSQLLASAATAHQPGDTQQGQGAGSGNLVVEGSSNDEVVQDSQGVGVLASDEHRAEDTTVGARVGNRVLTDEDLVGRVVRPLARRPLRREAGDEPEALDAARELRVGPRVQALDLCQVGAEDRVVVELPADRDEAVILQSIESGYAGKGGGWR